MQLYSLITFNSAWKKWALSKLLEKEAAAGYRILDLRDHLTTPGEKREALPYVLALPRDVHNAIVAIARADGLPAAQRFITLPVKALLAIGAKRFWSHAFMVMALGGSEKLIWWIGFDTKNYLLEETDPDEVSDDESILIVKLDSAKERADGNKAALKSAQIIQDLQAASNKIQVLDLSLDAGNKTGDDIDKTIRDFAAKNKKKIKKVIISGHGLPGHVITEGSGKLPLNVFSSLLSPLKDQFSKEGVSVFFESCLVANDEFAKQQVAAFSNDLLLAGSKVFTSQLVKSNGYNYGSLNSEVSASKPLTLMLPPLGEGIDVLLKMIIKKEIDIKSASVLEKPLSSAFQKSEYIYVQPAKK